MSVVASSGGRSRAVFIRAIRAIRAWLTAGLVVALAVPAASAAMASDDAPSALPDDRVVFCLSAEHRSGLVDAATALGLVKPGSRPDRISPLRGGGPVDLTAWRVRDSAAFRKACTALVGSAALAQAAPENAGGSGFLTWFLPILVGAGLAWGATEYRSMRDRGQAAANEIRAAAAEFRVTAGAYAASWVQTTVAGAPSAEGLDRSRTAAVASLSRTVGHRTRWRFARQVLADLNGPHYRAALTSAWQGVDQQGRRARAERIEEALRGFEADVEKIAAAVQSLSFPRRRRMRRGTPPSLLLPVA